MERYWVMMWFFMRSKSDGDSLNVKKSVPILCTLFLVNCVLVLKKKSKKLHSQLEAILSAIEILPFQEPADRQYAALRCHLENAGTPIGPNDMLIAAQAISLGLILVTANFKEFSQVPGLAVENWIGLKRR